MAKVLVLSAIKNTNLELYCVFDGPENKFTNWLKSKNINVIFWKITFLADLIKRYDGNKSINFCRGTYLCMELPYILTENNINDRYILYTDVDIMFIGAVELDQSKPDLFASSTDWNINDWTRFSTGIMVMNIHTLRQQYPKFLKWIQKNNYNFKYTGMGPCDQGAWNTFYKGKNNKLNQVYDWKPWWGRNDNASIIHFSGPKPNFINKVINQPDIEHLNSTDHLYSSIIKENIEGYKYYYNVWKNLLEI